MIKDKEEVLMTLRDLSERLNVCIENLTFLYKAILIVFMGDVLMVLFVFGGFFFSLFMSSFRMTVISFVFLIFCSFILYLNNVRHYIVIMKMCHACHSEGLYYVRQIVDTVDWTSLRKEQLYKGTSDNINKLMDRFYTESARCIPSLSKFDRHKFFVFLTGLILIYIYFVMLFVLINPLYIDRILAVLP